MIGWVRPKMLIPAHGEALHLAEHAKLARSAGVPEVLVCRNGDIVRLARGRREIVDEIPSGRVYKDGKLLVDAERRASPRASGLSFAGLVSVALAMTREGELAADPELELFGIPETDAAGVRWPKSPKTPSMKLRSRCQNRAAAIRTRWAKRSGGACAAAIAGRWDKKPVCHVHVLKV